MRVQTEDVLNELLCQWFVMSHIVLGFDQRLRLAVWLTRNSEWPMNDYNTETRSRADLVVWKHLVEVQSVLCQYLYRLVEALSHHPHYICGSLKSCVCFNAVTNMNSLPVQNWRNKQTFSSSHHSKPTLIYMHVATAALLNYIYNLVSISISWNV